MKNTFKLFIVEDDRMYQKMLTHVLKSDESLELHLFDNGQDCLDALGQNPDIISMDYTLPDLNGIELLSAIKNQNSDIEVIVLSGQGEMFTVSEVLKLGAYDFIAKDVTTKYRLKNAIKNLKELIALRKQVSELSSAF